MKSLLITLIVTATVAATAFADGHVRNVVVAGGSQTQTLNVSEASGYQDH